MHQPDDPGVESSDSEDELGAYILIGVAFFLMMVGVFVAYTTYVARDALAKCLAAFK